MVWRTVSPLDIHRPIEMQSNQRLKTYGRPFRVLSQNGSQRSTTPQKAKKQLSPAKQLYNESNAIEDKENIANWNPHSTSSSSTNEEAPSARKRLIDSHTSPLPTKPKETCSSSKSILVKVQHSRSPTRKRRVSFCNTIDIRHFANDLNSQANNVPTTVTDPQPLPKEQSVETPSSPVSPLKDDLDIRKSAHDSPCNTPTLDEFLNSLQLNDPGEVLSPSRLDDSAMKTPTLATLLSSLDDSCIGTPMSALDVTQRSRIQQNDDMEIEQPTVTLLPPSAPITQQRNFEQHTEPIHKAALTESVANFRLRTPQQLPPIYPFKTALNPITLNEFLSIAGIPFNDDVTLRQPSVPPRSSEVLRSLNNNVDRIRLSTLLAPELELFQWGCEQLKILIKGLAEDISQMETKIASQNPSIFTELRLSTGRRQESLKAALRQLKTVCRDQTKNQWYEWLVKCKSSLNETIGGNLEFISQENMYMKQMSSNAEQLYLCLHKEVLDITPQETITIGKDGTLISTMQIFGPEDKELTEEKSDILKILTGLQLWRLVSYNQEEIVFTFAKQFLLQFNLCSKDSRRIASKVFGKIPGVVIDPFYDTFILSSGVKQCLINTTKVEHLTEALDALSLTLGRLKTLITELEHLERHFTVTKSTKNLKESWVSIEISQLDKYRKFTVEFQIEHGYPMIKVKHNFINLFGNATASMVSNVLVKVPRGFNWVSRACQALCQME